ncbi:hypothetical protein PVIIG_03212 [Plasmodium vivax India VII]|uniref:Uncharacterized protein n=6 Tax=Plasmodium vivax TaxID=5855 RepID=A5K503_PLAVS|nr:hypothetical protein, conserved [Plasmodium vivax]KMZ80308.1 hypothetical protein PVIIG_03212 [Plasmodium vivax India VII]KMZ86695.1 hypothetical protein PVBG_05031 [Plasmodium vivax Brazil I]KMZ93145.1 hypothetical protein PVMG_04295 [Plasmodium vivax Mauritania I]KMZ99606.1 hypothetical protein PVNG_02333 [Plasmodium vivax North Korean]EDL45731.1 hypothetical protein, conserved [Plasmodium vivax]|eukprot:XP_001615458.1 hypothetical protein [Plasmodium vivax Sal-1]
MRRFNWPPQEASAIHPIEPYGKQFFIFNAFKRDPNFDSEVSNTVKPLLNPNNEKIPSETVLCVCDFAKRPLMFLNYLDFKILQASMDKIKEGFKKMEEKLDKTNYLDTKFGLMLKYNLNKTYGMQRVKKGEHNSWGMKKGVFRSRKT